MDRKIKFITISLILIFGALSCTEMTTPQKAEALIQKIEHYKEKEKQLPPNLSAIGEEESEAGPVYYLKKAADHYIVWYGGELGESQTWDSKQKRWK